MFIKHIFKVSDVRSFTKCNNQNLLTGHLGNKKWLLKIICSKQMLMLA
jgi:hypothetical protein